MTVERVRSAGAHSSGSVGRDRGRLPSTRDITYQYDAADKAIIVDISGGSCTDTVSKSTTFGYDETTRPTTSDPGGVVQLIGHGRLGREKTIFASPASNRCC
jgi:hypothetical protein